MILLIICICFLARLRISEKKRKKWKFPSTLIALTPTESVRTATVFGAGWLLWWTWRHHSKLRWVEEATWNEWKKRTKILRFNDDGFCCCQCCFTFYSSSGQTHTHTSTAYISRCNAALTVWNARLPIRKYIMTYFLADYIWKEMSKRGKNNSWQWPMTLIKQKLMWTFFFAVRSAPP